MAATLDAVLDEIRAIQAEARQGGTSDASALADDRAAQSPKGWTGPKEVDGLKTEGFWRSHQVPMSRHGDKPAHVELLEEWMRSYRPEELFDADGAAATGDRGAGTRGRRGAWAPIRTPMAGCCCASSTCRTLPDYAVTVPSPGEHDGEATARHGRPSCAT